MSVIEDNFTVGAYVPTREMTKVLGINFLSPRLEKIT